jgi:hypothetical protein
MRYATSPSVTSIEPAATGYLLGDYTHSRRSAMAALMDRRGAAGTRAGISETEKLSRFLRRMAEQLDVALEETVQDPLERDQLIREALPLWALTFELRGCLSQAHRDFLSHLLTCLSSPKSASDVIALRSLRDVIRTFADSPQGTTEKDIERLVVRLEESGYDLADALTRVPTSTRESE